MKDFKIKFWDTKLNKWEKANLDYIKGLQGGNSLIIKCNNEIVEKGIYVIVFHPIKNDIYEIRDLSKENNKHQIKKGELIIKGGKFENGLGERLIGGSGYAKFWKNDGEKYDRNPETKKLYRTLSDCVATNCEIYLIQMLNEYDKLVHVNEALLFNVIHEVFDDISPQEKKSEYYRINYGNSNLDEKLKKVVLKMELITNVTSSILLKGFEFRIPIIFSDFGIEMHSKEAKEIAVIIKLASVIINPTEYIPFYETQWLLNELLQYDKENSAHKQIQRDIEEVKKHYEKIRREIDIDDFLGDNFFISNSRDSFFSSYNIELEQFNFMFYLYNNGVQKGVSLQFRPK